MRGRSIFSWKRRGFTIVELLVVVAIIGILSTMVYINYTGYQKRARDSKRISDVNQIAQAVRMYAQERGTYYITYNDSIPNTYPQLPLGTPVGKREDNAVIGVVNYYHSNGWVNIKNTNQQPYSSDGYYSSPYSIIDALVSWGYLQQRVSDPMFGKKDVPNLSVPSPYDYMYYQNNASLYNCGGATSPCVFGLDQDDTPAINSHTTLFAIFASLESPRDIKSYATGVDYDGRSVGKSCVEINYYNNGMNYVYSSKTNRKTSCN